MMQQRRSELGLIQDDGMNIATQRLNQLNFELVHTSAQRAVTQARYSRISGFLKTGNGLESLPEVITSSSIQSLRAKLIGLEGQLSDLSQRYGPGHRSIAPVEAEIKSLRQQLMAEMRTVLNGVSNELETLRAQEEALKHQLDAAGNEVGRLSNGALTIRQLSTQLEANRDLYESLLKRHTETVALRDNQQPDTRVISDAQIPLSPTFPKKTRTLALATVGSIAFAFFVIFLAERFRNRFDRGEDIAQQLRLQVIAIPDLPRLWRMMAMKPRHFIEREPLSEFGSAFQRLRALLALGNSRRMPSIVLVTSTVAGEGKTTVAVCLGIASVSSGQRVIIVDCDFLQPSVHNVMGIDNGAGLSEVLIGTSVLEDVVRVISPSMAVLPSGNVRRGGIDLLNSSRMAMLLRTLQGNFDLVILDSAPVMRLSDPLILGSFADKTLLVTRRDWTTQNNAAEVASQLMLYGADIAAVIFNRSNDVLARDR